MNGCLGRIARMPREQIERIASGMEDEDECAVVASMMLTGLDAARERERERAEPADGVKSSRNPPS